jgi:hypothetical protein
MKLETSVQEEVFRRVAGWAVELFGAAAKPHPDGARMRIEFGSSFVDVSVSPVGDKEAVVVARAPVVAGASITPELMRYLLSKNTASRFGAFGIADDGEIELRYALVGTTCQKAELRASLQYVMLAADLADDEIVKRWGGIRARDRNSLAPRRPPGV